MVKPLMPLTVFRVKRPFPLFQYFASPYDPRQSPGTTNLVLNNNHATKPPPPAREKQLRGNGLYKLARLVKKENMRGNNLFKLGRLVKRGN